MKHFMAGAVTGIIATSAFVLMIASVDTGESEAIAVLRCLEPGMSITDVQGVLGEPNRRFDVGEGFGKWSELPVPDDYHQSHGALLYVTAGIGPQVFFIFFDEDELVTFVTCKPT